MRPALSRTALEARLKRRVARDPLLRSARDEAERTGVPLWLVGGYVRDLALGRPTGDIDFAAGPRAATLVRRLEERWQVGTFRVRRRGVTTWRTAFGGRAVDVVDAGRRGLAADLRRRELTINAIAFDLVAGRVLDPLGGLQDLRARIFRLPRPGVVRDDPVRALRAARFMAELPDFRFHAAARDESRCAGPAAARAPVERIRDELDALLTAPDPARGLALLVDFGLLDAVLAELTPLRTCLAGARRPDVWSHTVGTVDAAARRHRLPGASGAADPESARLLRWTLLLHDVAKPETFRRDPDGAPSFHGHEVIGARRARAILARLSFPRAFIRRVSRLVLFHLRPHHLAEAGAPERGMRRLVRESGDDLPILVVHAACDAVASGAPDAAAKWRRLRPVLDRLLALYASARAAPVARLVDGREVMAALGIAAGPDVGAALQEIRERQERGEIADRAAALRYLEERARRT